MKYFNIKLIVQQFSLYLFIIFSLTVDATESSRHWEAIGPIGGATISQIYFSPGDESLAYGFSENILHKSSDSGLSWIRVETQNGTELSSDLLVDSNNSQTLYAINNGLLSKSVDGGQQWNDISQGLSIDVNSFFLLNSSSTQPLLVLINGNDPANDEQTLATSQDGGLNWTLAPTTIKKINNQSVKIEGIAPDNINTLYGSILFNQDIDSSLISNGVPQSSIYQDDFWDSVRTNTYKKVLYKSINGGVVWVKIQPDTHQYTGNLQVHPLDNNRLYGTFISSEKNILLGNPYHFIELYPSSQEKTQMQSIDGGITWVNFSSQASIQPDSSVFNITFDPTDTNILYAEILSSKGGIGFNFEIRASLWKSIDSGKSWTIFYENTSHPIHSRSIPFGHIGIKINPNNNQHLFYHAPTGQITFDGGENWINIVSPLRRVPGILAVAQDDSNVMYMADYAITVYSSSAGEENILFTSLDGGKTWGKMPLTIDSDDQCHELIINPKNNKNILCVANSTSDYDGYSLHKSVDSGNSWHLIKRFNVKVGGGTYSYANDGKTIYHLIKNTLSKSTDNGDTWNNVNTLPSNLKFHNPSGGFDSSLLVEKIIIDPGNADVIFMTGAVEQTTGVYKSIDGGKNWLLQLVVKPSLNRFKLLLHPNFPNRLLLVNGTKDSRNVVIQSYLTVDGGNSWKKLLEQSLPLHSSFTFRTSLDFRNLMFNPKNPDGLFKMVDGASYESKNLGLSWNDIPSEFYHDNLIISANNIYSHKMYNAGVYKLSPAIISTESKDCLFRWAEQQYPTYFSATLAGTLLTNDYSYRYYDDTNTYLGVFQDEKIHMLEADLTDEIKDVGYFEYYQHLAGCD